jgi:polyhydroxyalkanoate synthase subunit PhaC
MMLAPRPFPLYLQMASLLWGGLPLLSGDNTLSGQWLRNNPFFESPFGQELKNILVRAEQQQARDKLKALGQQQFQQFLNGVNVWSQAPRPSPLPPMPTLWQQGQVRLLEYAQAGRPLLVIPSLINRYHILDLGADHSLLRYLASQGLRPLLLDWGEPDKTTLDHNFNDYYAQYLNPVLEFLGEPVPVMGHCMGGMMALALAQLKPDAVSRLLLLATPWDFSEGVSAGQRAWLELLQPQLEYMCHAMQCLPVDVLQALLMSYNPFSVLKRFIRLSIDPNPLALLTEDWLSNGVPLAAPIAKETLFDWYLNNSPLNGGWRVLDTVINPSLIHQPTLMVNPLFDRLVPPKSSQPLLSLLPNAKQYQPQTGHLSSVVGPSAPNVWEAIRTWFA